MASTATTNLKLQKAEQGVTQTWGTKRNVDLDITDAAISGMVEVATTGGNTTLDNVDFTLDNGKYAILRVTGATTSNATITVPTAAGFSKTYHVINETTEGGSSTTLTIKTSGHAGVAIARNCSAEVLVRNIGGTHEVSYLSPVVVRSTGAPNSGSGAVASAVEVTPTGNLSSVTAQAALAELQGDIDTINTSLSNKQPLDSDLTAIAALANTKGNVIVGNGSAWTALGVGSNYTLYAADSSAASGTAWTALGTIITNQTAETSIALADTVPVYDASATAGRKFTVENILKGINLATEDTSPDGAADFVLTYDTSASGIKKALISSFAASDTLKGPIEIAIQSEMETGSSTTLAVTPGRQHYHPGHPKAWAVFNGSGTPAYIEDYGCSSITDNGLGDYTINFDTAFAGVNDYGAVGAFSREPAGQASAAVISANDTGVATKSTTAFQIFAKKASDGAEIDPPEAGIVFAGDI